MCMATITVMNLVVVSGRRPRIGSAPTASEMGLRGLHDVPDRRCRASPGRGWLRAIFDADTTTLRPDTLPLAQAPAAPALDYIGALLAATTLVDVATR